MIPVTVPKKQFDDYYNGCCNATFWPLFHSMPDRAVFQADKWEVSLSASPLNYNVSCGYVIT